MLSSNGTAFKQDNVFTKLVHGSGKWNNVLTHVEVVLLGCAISTNFIVLPNAENTSTLQGIKDVIVLDISNKISY